MSFVGWPDIEAFHNVRKAVQTYPELLRGNKIIQYRAKVKLHGTNAAVQVRGDTVIAQSRTQVITPGDDNMGFARWVASQEEMWKAPDERSTIFYGEWCGPGIMKGTAVNQIQQKVFAVFAAILLPVEDESPMIVNPVSLQARIGHIPGVHIIPWYGSILDIPWTETPEVVQPILDGINAEIAAVEACDPWVKDTFGVEGVGEGLVYYPLGLTRKSFSDLVFKAKGEKHKIVAKSAPAQMDPSVAAGVDAFVTMVLTEARLEQGARATAGGELVFEKRLMGPFLAWIGKDVEKETTAELQASGLEWKPVQKRIQEHARAWYLAKAETIS